MNKQSLLYRAEGHLFNVNAQTFFFETSGCNLYELDPWTRQVFELCDGSKTQHEIRMECIENWGIPDDAFDAIIKDSMEQNLISNIPYSNVTGKFLESGLPSEASPITSIALHVIHDCNLRCKYCYGDGGSYGGGRSVMNEGIAKKAIDFLLDASGDSKNLHINFFGGEPLMNFELIKTVTEYCRIKEKETGKSFDLGMTTNGTLLSNEIIEYLDRNNITVGISIDGPKDIHDEYRVFTDGSGSFDCMMKGVSQLLKNRNGNVTARITITHKHPDLFNIASNIAEMGFKKVNIAPVGVKASSPLKINKKDQRIMLKEFEKAAEEFLGNLVENKPFVLNFFYSHLEILHNKNYIMYNCGAGRRYVGVTPDGNIYLCHRFAGVNEYKLGHVDTGLIPEKQKHIIEAHVENKTECSKCWARYLCGGGCFYNAIVKGVDLLGSQLEDCDFLKSFYEICMYLYWKLSKIENGFLDNMFSRREKNKRYGQKAV